MEVKKDKKNIQQQQQQQERHKALLDLLGYAAGKKDFFCFKKVAKLSPYLFLFMQWTSQGFWRFFEFEEFEDASKTGRQCWRLYLAQSLLLFRLPLQPCLELTKKVGISHISLPSSLGTCCCCCCLPLLSHLAVSPSQVPGAGGQVRGELPLDCKRKGEKCHFEKKLGIKQQAVHT